MSRPAARPGLVVSVDELRAAAPGSIVLLDTRLAQTPPSGRERYAGGHLPGAAYVDLDDDLAAPPGRGGRHPLPDPGDFVAAMRRAGVHRDSAVVVYDEGPGTAAARLWWLLHHYGHDDVRVLDGGLSEWARTGGALTTEPVAASPGDWTGTPGRLPVVDADGAAAAAVLIDVRAAARYRGESEPLDPVAGHIPGAVNAPLTGTTDDRGRFLPAAALRRRFAGLGADRDGVAVYCGSGVTATQTILALRLAGLDAALYPGSWSGWISDPERPVATGPEPGHRDSP